MAAASPDNEAYLVFAPLPEQHSVNIGDFFKITAVSSDVTFHHFGNRRVG